jgi:hypothetical protein
MADGAVNIRGQQPRERVPWSDTELNAIVDVYLRMLELEKASQPYVKAEYNREVQSRTGRARGSVEYKFQNISHVLNEAKQPYIEGYKPAANVQAALRPVVLNRIYGISSEQAGQPIGTPSSGDPLRDYRRRYAGVCLDPVLRKAVEKAAVEQATEYYEDQGYKVEDVGLTHSFDLRAIRDGVERHIEVKGSQVYIEKIQLTRNEVLHARDFENTDLVIVRNVPWERQPNGAISTHPGVMEVLMNWRPAEVKLRATTFEYLLD